MARLGREVEKVKIALSTHHESAIWLDELFPSMSFRHVFTRAQFEDLTASLVCPLTMGKVYRLA